MLISGPLNREIKETVDHLPTGIGSQIMIKYYQQYCRYLKNKKYLFIVEARDRISQKTDIAFLER